MSSFLHNCKYCGMSHELIRGWYYCPKVFGGHAKVKLKKKSDKIAPCKSTLPVCMSYDTYTYLRDLIEEGRNNLHREFINAHNFIPPQSNKDMKKRLVSGRQVALNLYRERDRVFHTMAAELRAAAESSNKHNSSKELRRFWGVDE